MSQSTRDHRRFLGLARVTAGRLVAALEFVAFWCVLALPVVYAAVYLLSDVAPTVETVSVAVGVHALALVVGHRHSRPGDERTRRDRTS